MCVCVVVVVGFIFLFFNLIVFAADCSVCLEILCPACSL